MQRRLLLTDPTNRPSKDLKVFGDIVKNHVFWDPFTKRIFVKVSDTQAGCLVYPQGYNQKFVSFEFNEQVYDRSSAIRAIAPELVQRQKALINTFKQLVQNKVCINQCVSV